MPWFELKKSYQSVHQSFTIGHRVRYIYLLRHAHAVAGDASMSDAMRPLSSRGIAECDALARWVSAHSTSPQVILCSNAQRTRQTLAQLFAVTGLPVTPDYLAKLYLASTEDIISLLQGLPEDVTHVLVVGHNPGLHGVAMTLAQSSITSDAQRLELGLVTAGLVGLRTSLPWEHVQPECAELLFYRSEAESS